MVSGFWIILEIVIHDYFPSNKVAKKERKPCDLGGLLWIYKCRSFNDLLILESCPMFLLYRHA